MAVDPRFIKEEGWEVFTGNELLVKGCLETEQGIHLLTGYPGSPVSGFFDTLTYIKDLLINAGIRATIANNEAIAAAMINGSQMAPLRAISVQKSVGVHVAADALALGNLVGAHPAGGVIIVLGDDPWSESTQVPADSRFIARHLMIPVLEPADFQELKDWIDLAFKLSRESELYIGYLINTNQADGGGSVRVRPNYFPQINIHNRFELDTSEIDLDRNVLLPPRTWWKEQNINLRFNRLWESARKYKVDTIIKNGPPPLPIGFISSGEAYLFLRHALTELGIDQIFPILKLGIIYPIDPAIVETFLQDLEHVIIVEQRRAFIEEQIITIAHDLQRRGKSTPLIWGKKFPFQLNGLPSVRGLHPSIIIEKIAQLFLAWPNLLEKLPPTNRIKEELELIQKLDKIQIQLPQRTPTFCPGCPHRDSASLLMEIKKLFKDPIYMKRTYGRGPVDLVFHGDTGCYTMLMFEPTKDLMHNYSGMGLGGGTGAGIDPFITNKQVVFMGDSTFFHSGMIAISNSLKNGHDITYIILDNSTTAMTGHQTTPARPEGLLGESTFSQQIDKIIQAITKSEESGITVVKVNPADRQTYRKVLEETILKDGVKIIIAEKECAITATRKRTHKERQIIKNKGYLPRKEYINIATDVCEGCLECTKATGCPGLTIIQTDFGTKVQTDMTWCVGDGACARATVPIKGIGPVKPCPSFEQVIIKRKAPPRSLLPSIKDKINSILPPLLSHRPSIWRMYLAGVGGMGVGTLGAILVLAGHYDGYRVLFCDKKGLAIRNGMVYSMVSYINDPNFFTSHIIPYGKADLLIGLDLLEAARAIEASANQKVSNPNHTVAVVNLQVTPTILSLLGRDKLDPAQYEAFIKANTRVFLGYNASIICERFFGTQKPVNLVLLGIAYQHGYIPVTIESLRKAIIAVFGADHDDNLSAFELGRWIATNSQEVLQLAAIGGESPSVDQIIQEKSLLLKQRHWLRPSIAYRYEKLMSELKKQLNLPDRLMYHLAIRVYDLIEYGGFQYAVQFVEWIERFVNIEKKSDSLKATEALIKNLHKVMAIKDEIYVAELLTRKEKYKNDMLRFNIDPSRGDKIIYKHFNRIYLNLFGIPFQIDIKSSDWMLRILRNMRWIRVLFPNWHKKELQFKQWYIELLPTLLEKGAKTGQWEKIAEILSLPEQLTGFKHIRYLKMDIIRAEATKKLNTLSEYDKQMIGQAFAA